MTTILLKGGTIVNEGESFVGSILITDDKITRIVKGEIEQDQLQNVDRIIDATGKTVMPGVIDDQVHFREPGLTHKADIQSESMAAVAGGITSYMEMPNTNPQTVDEAAIDWKLARAASCSFANYGFYIGANNSNVDDIKKIDSSKICGVKVFMGSSTGNMLVDNRTMLERIFQELPYVITTHCEKEEIIKKNIEYYTSKYGEDLSIEFHSKIRSEEACYASSAEAVELAHKHNTRLHLLHLSTAKELTLLEAKPLEEKRITGEVCVHHLWFTDADYATYGNRIKWNPSIKTMEDRDALVNALHTNKLDVVATDHAPHLMSEKQGSCLKAASGGPLVQHSLLTMLELVKQGKVTMEQVVEKMCHAPAYLFQVEKRGYLREGYFADIVVVDPEKPTLVEGRSLLSRCGWSPFESFTFSSTIDTTIINGGIAYEHGKLMINRFGKALTYNRD